MHDAHTMIIQMQSLGCRAKRVTNIAMIAVIAVAGVADPNAILVNHLNPV